MHKTYPELSSDHEITRSLTEMGIDVFTPSSTMEEELALTFDEFSNFVLHQEKDTCIEILENDDSGCVGELQGGSEAYSIYRVSFPINDDDSNIEDNNNAAIKLLNLFNKYTGRSSKSAALTMDKIKHYMLGMCARRSRERNCVSYTSLGNIMFIMQFGGPTHGQVRHIDNMVPNLQICLYMSNCCPSTIVYEMDDGNGLPVIDGNSLIDFWERTKDKDIPQLIKKILQTNGDVKLKSKWYTKYFTKWDTLNSQLFCFGKLYQPVLYQLGLRETEPGTTLLAGGNEIHAGPPTTTDLGRMFAFAIGIPAEEEEEETASIGSEEETEEHENDGEVQYSPVLLHIDFCCLLFSILDYEYSNGDNVAEVQDAKHYLVEILIELIVDYPMKAYLLQIDEERSGIRSWLEHVLERIENKQSINAFVEDAVTSEVILYSPDVIIKRRKKKKKSKKHRLKESLLT